MLRDKQKWKTEMPRMGPGERVFQRTENEREREEAGKKDQKDLALPC